VHYFFDESGDYAFPTDRFDCYVQAVLICPDSRLEELDRFVSARRGAFAVEELHASELSDEQLLEIADFIRHSSCQLLAHATDTFITTAEQVAQFRLDQAATLKRNLDWYRRESTKAIGAPVSEIERWMDRHIKRAGLPSQISHGEFAQAHYLIELIFDALQKSLLVYVDDSWAADFNEFRFVLDGKLPTKMAAGEKYLNDSILPALGSREGSSLSLADSWREEPRHPFIQKFERERGRIRGRDVTDVIDLKAVFEHGLCFRPSHQYSGLQLVDAVAHIVRRAVLEPDNTAIQSAYDTFRASLRNTQQRCLTIHRLRVGGEDRSSLGRYRPLYGLARSN
jgi:hypothetical protein